jgi:superfamily II DNA or RNA helicase
MTEYATFLASKVLRAPSSGHEVGPESIHPRLFPFQRDLVRWAIRKGRAALFADTGLGKTGMQLEWARLTGERTLILAPLAVSQQTVREAALLGIDVTYARHQGEAVDGITITNYERLDRFDPAAFGAVVLDESSILKSFDGKTRTALIASFGDTPYRLACTATPAPNDIAELANHAEFLSVMTRVEMLAAFFVHDDEGWRLKGHAREAFWKWLASWGMSVRAPSDLGYDDDGYELPELTVAPVLLPVEWTPSGQLFASEPRGITERSALRRSTVTARIEAAAALVRAQPDEQWLVWTGLNDEAAGMARAVPGAVNVQGSDDADVKALHLTAFAEGRLRVLVSKPSIAGFGMNFQRCARMVFVGLGDSYEQYYQAIRRSWRYGQTRPVTAFVVLTEPEETVFANVLRKEREAQEMAAELARHVAQYERAEIAGLDAHDPYEPTVPMVLPSWVAA